MKLLSMYILAAIWVLSLFVPRPFQASAAELTDPIPEAISPSNARVQLVPLAAGLTAPNWGTVAPGHPNRLIVTDQVGILWEINIADGTKRELLNVGVGGLELLVTIGIAGPGTFDERGLLGVAFHPNFAQNGLLYTYTSEPVDGIPDFTTGVANHQSVVSEWTVLNPADPAFVVDPLSRRVLLRVDEPQFNHNAGAVNFGPDGMLYIAFGDGGAGDDEAPGHVPGGNGQDPSNVLGTILRIDPTGSNAANGAYGIPLDNPFFVGGPGPFGGEAGCGDGFCDEIFAYGLRNPFRFSFDAATGDLYAGDVGQNDIEEVDIVVAGGNYGWRFKEGTFCFDPNGSAPGFVTDDPDCSPPGEELIDPVAQYDHDEGTAIIGGFVYRGQKIRSLRGRYIFGDLSRAFGAREDGRVFTLNQKQSEKHFLMRRHLFPTSGPESASIRELFFRRVVDGVPNLGGLGFLLLGFGQDAHGEVYVLANATGVPFPDQSGALTGVVLKLAPARGRKLR